MKLKKTYYLIKDKLEIAMLNLFKDEKYDLKEYYINQIESNKLPTNMNKKELMKQIHKINTQKKEK